MIMAPIYGGEDAETCRRPKNPALCRWPQLLRLLALAALAGGFALITLAPERAKAQTPSVFDLIDVFQSVSTAAAALARTAKIG